MDRIHGPKLTVVRSKVGMNLKRDWSQAISADNVRALTSLLNIHDPDQLIGYTADNGKSALMVASKKGALPLAQRLVAVGADVNEKTETQGTPLMFAVVGGHLNMAQWLLDEGADIHARGSNGWTALTIAAAKGNVTLLQWLIRQGANAQVRDVYRYTPLLRAVDNGFLQAAALLLSLPETDVHARDEYENTALHHAVFSNEEAMVNLLLDHGADPTMKNRNGLSAVDVVQSMSSHSQALLELLNAQIREEL